MDIESMIKKSLQEKLERESQLEEKIAESERGMKAGLKAIQDILDEVKQHLPDLGYEIVYESRVKLRYTIHFSTLDIPFDIWGKYNINGGIHAGFRPLGGAYVYTVYYNGRYYCEGNIQDLMGAIIKALVNRSTKITLG
jgi:hypothetical protein